MGAAAPAHISGQAERLGLRKLPRPTAAPYCCFLGRSAARHAAAVVALCPKHKQAACSRAAAPCRAGVRPAAVLCRPLVCFKRKRLRHSGRLGLHVRDAQLATAVLQDALAAGRRWRAQRRGGVTGLPAALSCFGGNTRTCSQSISRKDSITTPSAHPLHAYLTGRALNLGMAAISSASTTSRGLKRGGRTRCLVAKRGECGTVSAPC